MAENDFIYDKEHLPINWEQKCPVILVLDVSGSMHGEAIKELNEGLKAFHNGVRNDTLASQRLEIVVLTFNDKIEVVQDFALCQEFEMPELSASGTTKLVDAMECAFKMLDGRKKWYKDTGQNYFRPYIILMTDGYPDKDQDINGLKLKIDELYKYKHANCWFFGVTKADMDLLKELSHDESIVAKISGFEFVKFFKWLSDSMTKIASSKQGETVDIQPDPADNMFQIKIS